MDSLLPVTAIVLTNRDDKRFIACLQSLNFVTEVMVVTASDTPLKISLASIKENLRESQKVALTDLGHQINDFSEVRTQVQKLATQPWVFFIDSDEQVETLKKEQLSQLMSKLTNTDIHGLFVQRKDIFLNKELHWGEVGQDWLLRFGRKEQLVWSRSVHETANVTGQSIRSDILLKHNSHLNIAEFLKDTNAYAAREAKSRSKTSKPDLVFQLITFPLGKFVWNFIFKLGFLDGWRGLVYAAVMSWHSVLVRVYTYEHQFNYHDKRS